MAKTSDALLSSILKELTALERAGGVAYVADDPIAAGTTLSLPGIQVDVRQQSALAFVDPDPLANWAHPCRYLLIATADGGVTSFGAQLPPFGPQSGIRWRVAYKAASVPDAVLVVRESSIPS